MRARTDVSVHTHASHMCIKATRIVVYVPCLYKIQKKIGVQNRCVCGGVLT
jgi:hypothetical protein